MLISHSIAGGVHSSGFGDSAHSPRPTTSAVPTPSVLLRPSPCPTSGPGWGQRRCESWWCALVSAAVWKFIEIGVQDASQKANAGTLGGMILFQSDCFNELYVRTKLVSVCRLYLSLVSTVCTIDRTSYTGKYSVVYGRHTYHACT